MMARSWRVWLAFLGVFLAGAVAGGFVSMRFVKRPPSDQSDEIALKIMQRYADRLQLSEEQRAVIEPHVMRAAEEMHRIRAQAAEAMQTLERAVERELTDEQRQTLEAMQAEQRARWKKWMQKKRDLERSGALHGHDRPQGKPPPPAEHKP